jgi:hypothetical protein
MTSVDELEMEELKRDTEGGAAVRVQATHSFPFINYFVKNCANIEQNAPSINSRFRHEVTSCKARLMFLCKKMLIIMAY